jgi:hypothetical protein
MSSGIVRLDPEHSGETHSRFHLSDAPQICVEADRIAPARSVDREIRPSSGPEVNPERPVVPVRAMWIERHVFVALNPAIGQPAPEERGQHR